MAKTLKIGGDLQDAIIELINSAVNDQLKNNIISVINNAGIIQGQIVDVQTSGTNPLKTSIKFSNGILINTIKYTYTNIGCNTAWGGTYASATQNPGAYKTAFTTLLSVTASVRPNGGNHWYMFTESSESLTNAPQYQLLRGTKTNVSGQLYVTAFGLWK